MSTILLKDAPTRLLDRRTIVFWQYAVVGGPLELDPELFECVWIDDPACIVRVENIDTTRPCIFFVSLQTRTVLEKKGFHPIISDTPFMFQPSFLLVACPEYVLSPDMVFLPMGRIGKIPETMPDLFFIRPNSGSKTFPGQVLKRSDIKTFMETYRSVSPYDMVGVATPHDIKLEIRTFLDTTNGQIISLSPYHHADEANVAEPQATIPDDLTDIAKKVADSLFNAGISEIIVADFAVTADGTKLIELNSVSTSGIYNASVHEIVNAIMRYI